MNIIEILTENEICLSRGEARKFVIAGGVKINGCKISDVKKEIDECDSATVTVGKTVSKKVNIKSR